MGIQGLNKLLRESGILENTELHDSQMIIDGSSLYYSLYFYSDPKLDQSHGGDYPGFKAEVCRFFQALTDCNIYPLVVLNGGSDPLKQKTLEDRLQNKIEKAVNIAKGKPLRGGDVLPPLIKDVFKQILIERKVSFLQSFGEADADIVHFANKYGCPVLSHDSDFYIYDVTGDVISSYPREFRWKTPGRRRIPAKRYRRSRFCETFGVDGDLIPVFASIAGNDYSTLEDSGQFVRRHPQSDSQETRVQRLRAMLDFLRGLDLSKVENTEQKQEQALTEALEFVGEKDRDQFLRSIKKYINPAELTPPPDDLPERMHKPIREGRLNTFVIDVICQKQIMLTPLVDDFSQPSSYCAAGRIRQFYYGLLIEQGTCTEFDRDGIDVRRQEVEPTAHTLPTVSEEELRNLRRHGPLGVFLEALSLDSETFDFGDVSDDMKLPLCVTNFWWRYRQQHHPSDENIHYLLALLLWFVCDPDGKRVEGKEPVPDVAHAFNQWQCCFIASLHLNQLLGRPLPEPECARIYCGPVVHQLVDKLQSGVLPEELGLRTEQQQQLFESYQTNVIGWRLGVGREEES